jgi:hypothetical protein
MGFRAGIGCGGAGTQRLIPRRRCADKTSSMVSEGKGQERRAAPRFRCGGDAEVFLPKGGVVGRGRIADLSAGGCCLEGKYSLWAGAPVELWAKVRGTPLRVAAMVVSYREERLGLRFRGLTLRKMEQIQMLIEELEQSEQQMVRKARELAVSRRAEEKKRECG